MFSQNAKQFMLDLYADVYKWLVEGRIDVVNQTFINVPTLDIGCIIKRAFEDERCNDDRSFMRLFGGAKDVLRASILRFFNDYGHMFRVFDFGIKILDVPRLTHMFANIDSGKDVESAYDAMLEKFHAPAFVNTTRRP